jgi:HSP20 family protein
MSTELTRNGSRPQEPQPQPQQSAQPQRRVEWRVPPVDVYESSERVLIHADLPGVKKDDLRVRIDHRSLVIEGRRSATLGWRREFTLPDTIDAQNITAELTCGVLTLTLPVTERAKPRTIEVKAV